MSLIDGQDTPSLYEIIYVGYLLRSLWEPEENWPIDSTGDEDGNILARCRDIKNSLDRFGLELCSKTIEKELDVLFNKWEKGLSENKNLTLGDSTDRLRVITRSLFTILQQEGPERPIFITMPARQIRVEALLRDPVGWFGMLSTFMLPADTIIDFQEAARCFSVGFSPSAIIFSLRATEGVLRTYYEKVSGKNSERLQWLGMQKDLRTESFDVPNTLLQVLDELRKKRNQAMHTGRREPANWGDDAALEILEQCQLAISQMSRDLKRRNLSRNFSEKKS